MYPFKGSSQENAVVEEKDNSKQTSIFSFNGIGVSADLFGFAYSLLDEYTSAEVAIEANLGNRFYPTAEVGLGWCNTQDETTGIRYKTNAPYFKVGLNYNFFTSKNKPDPDHYIYGLARFAWTGFEYDIETPPIIDPVWGGSTSLNLDGVSGNCSWAEIGAGIKVKIFKGFHMGWSIRYKIRLSEKRGNNSNMWYIPGFGINKSTTFGGTYSIIYEIPFK
jgi:hypothetical protein